MKMRLIVAGAGGQGVLELANYICYFDLLKGRHVACTPSYGPETRGGKVKCYVVTSEEEIDSPIVEEADYLIVMNVASMVYVSLLRKGGTLLMNSSLVLDEPDRNDIRVFKIPATEIAVGLKDFSTETTQDTKIAANSVMFGACLSVTGEELNLELIRVLFSNFLTGRKAAYIPLNLAAVQRGAEFAENAMLTPVP